MTKAIALSKSTFEAARKRQLDIVRSAIVLSCGAALIFAGQPVPL